MKYDNFLLGFEIELIYDGSEISRDRLSALFRDLNKSIIVGDDGSIEGEGRFYTEGGMEVKTPPLPFKKAFELLHKVFALVEEYGYTNYSTGFHVNVSPKSNKLYYALNPLKLLYSDIWNKIKTEFNREQNEYCDSIYNSRKKIKTNLDLFHAISKTIQDNEEIAEQGFTAKYLAISLRNYHAIRGKTSRLEIRAMGGQDYHKKLSLIKRYTEMSLTTFLKSCNI